MPKIKSQLKQLKIVPIKPFRNIRMGDPYYFEELEQEKRKPGTIDKKQKETLEKITLDAKLYPHKNGIVIIKEIEENTVFPEIKYSYYAIDIILSDETGTQAINDYEVYATQRHYTDSIRALHEIGCDTAQLLLCIDGKFDEFGTGGDGYYGYALELKRGYGFVASLIFDADLYSFSDIEKIVSYLFTEDIDRYNIVELATLTNHLMEKIEEFVALEEKEF